MSTPSETPRRRRLAPPVPLPPDLGATTARAALDEASLAPEDRPADGCHDTDAARRLVASLGDDARFVPNLGWIWWDGKRWKTAMNDEEVDPDLIKQKSTDRAAAFTLDVRREIYAGEKANPRIAKAEALQSNRAIQAAASMAAHHPKMSLPFSELNTDDWALNTENGILDLRTGELRPHHREAYITRITRAKYDPEASHPALTRLLSNLDAKTPGVSDYLARCFGCALTGDVSVESIFMILGEGGSGKTTIADSFLNMLGGYGQKAEFSTFADSKNGKQSGSASPDLVRFAGSRFILASEGGQQTRLDAGKVKQLTGGETVAARAMYSNRYTTIRPTWKLFLISNFDPRTDSDDTGLHRRVTAMYFYAVPKDQVDPNLKHTLMVDPAARAALLAWAVRGCRDWQARGGGRAGLCPPDGVVASTTKYWESQDTMLQWWEELLERGAVLDEAAIEAKTVFNSEFYISSTEVFEHYARWCRRNGIQCWSLSRFNKYMLGKGMLNTRRFPVPGGKQIRVYLGLKRMDVNVDLRAVDEIGAQP